MIAICSNCQARPVCWSGRCRRCYAYWHRNGVERPADLEQRYTERLCKEPGCTTTLRYPFRGYCRRHYDLWYIRTVRYPRLKAETKPRPAPHPEPVRIPPRRLGCPHCGRLLVQGQCPMACAS